MPVLVAQHVLEIRRRAPAQAVLEGQVGGEGAHALPQCPHALRLQNVPEAMALSSASSGTPPPLPPPPTSWAPFEGGGGPRGVLSTWHSVVLWAHTVPWDGPWVRADVMGAYAVRPRVDITDLTTAWGGGAHYCVGGGGHCCGGGGTSLLRGGGSLLRGGGGVGRHPARCPTVSRCLKA